MNHIHAIHASLLFCWPYRFNFTPTICHWKDTHTSYLSQQTRSNVMAWPTVLFLPYSLVHCVVIVIVTHYLTLSDAVMVTRDDRTIPYIEIPPTNYNNIWNWGVSEWVSEWVSESRWSVSQTVNQSVSQLSANKSVSQPAVN